MVNPRDVLNKLKWKDGFSLSIAEIYYIHRGATNDTKIISGEKIIKLEKTFMKTTTAMIPYHRIFKICYRNQIIYQRFTNK
jgi:uncharacterized protein (UPF0248 family)